MRPLLALALISVIGVLAAGCASATADPRSGADRLPNAASQTPAPTETGQGTGASARSDSPGPSRSTPARASTSAGATPDLLGAEIEQVRRILADVAAAGLHVLAFEPDGPVTAQFPEAGAPLPQTDPVLVWLGTPPEPPAPPEPSPTTPAETTDPEPSTPADSTASTDRDEDARSDASSTHEEGPRQRADDDASGGAPAPSTGRVSPRNQAASPAGTTMSGLASWYGPGFAGRTTACGGTFDPSALTFASRELRCGTTARISGPGGTVEATVTDWGPAEWTDRRFDLSQATFAAVAPLSRGVVEVTVEILD